MELPILTIYIYNGSDIDAPSAYSMELLAIVTALSIISHTQTDSTVYSDCQSAVKKLNKLLTSSTPLRSSTTDVSLLSIGKNLLRNHNQLKWIKGHPERDQPDETTWTREMWGNHLADRAASGSLNTKPTYQYRNDSIYTLYTTPLPSQQASPLSASLSPNNLWYIGKSNGHLTSRSLTQPIHLQRLHQYLLTRDGHRAAADPPLPPKWQRINIPLASTL